MNPMVTLISSPPTSSSGFSSGLNEWRNTCTSCRCSRLCHDISIGSTCCGIDRIGFDSNFILNNNNNNVEIVNGGGNGVRAGSCHRTVLAEAEGYSWIPPVILIWHLVIWEMATIVAITYYLLQPVNVQKLAFHIVNFLVYLLWAFLLKLALMLKKN